MECFARWILADDVVATGVVQEPHQPVWEPLSLGQHLAPGVPAGAARDDLGNSGHLISLESAAAFLVLHLSPGAFGFAPALDNLAVYLAHLNFLLHLPHTKRIVTVWGKGYRFDPVLE